MRLLCPKCGEFLHVRKNGVTVRPRNYLFGFHADLWECPKCGNQVLLLAPEEDPDLFEARVDYDFTGDKV